MNTKTVIRTHQVYVICDARKPGDWVYGNWAFKYKPFYVGQTSRLSERMREHLFGRRSKVGVKMRASLEATQHVQVETIWSSDDFKEAVKKESEAIALIGRRDLSLGPLVNVHSGSHGADFYALSKGQKARYKRLRRDCPEKIKEGMRHLFVGIRKYYDSLTPEQRRERGRRIAAARVANGSESQRITSLTYTKRLNAARTYKQVLSAYSHITANFRSIPDDTGCVTQHKCEFHGEFLDHRHKVADRVKRSQDPCKFCYAEQKHTRKTNATVDADRRRHEFRC